MRFSAIRAAAVSFFILSVVLPLVGCGGESKTAPTPTVSNVTITTTNDMLKVKESVTFTASAAHSDGSSAPVTQWGSDAPHIATAEAASGKVTGVGPGNATIMADHDGMRGTKLVRVVPDFQGRWDGDYSITACTESGAFRGFCEDFYVDKTMPTTMKFSQNRDRVEGNFSLGQLTGNASGVVGLAGGLSLSDFNISSGSFNITVNMVNLIIDANDRMQGTFRATFTSPGYSGQGRIDARLRVVVKTAAAFGVDTPQVIGPATLRDLLSALGRRP